MTRRYRLRRCASRRTVLIGLLLLPPSLLAQPDASQIGISRLQKEALAGDPWAQLNLGAAYDHGLSGVQANPARAVRWYRAAAEQGLDKAQFNLAHCLATGHGVVQDYAEARVWMRRAAQQGLADAQFLLGVMLSEGLGGGADAEEGRTWLQQAAQGGNPDAAEYLKNSR